MCCGCRLLVRARGCMWLIHDTGSVQKLSLPLSFALSFSMSLVESLAMPAIVAAVVPVAVSNAVPVAVLRALQRLSCGAIHVGG